MTSGAWLENAVTALTSADIATARLDALVLLEDVTNKDRGWLLAHPEFELSPAYLKQLKNLLTRRSAHEPLAYVRGKTEFYGRNFVVTPVVLEPRPESETMIDLLKEISLFKDSALLPQHPVSNMHTSHETTAKDAQNRLDPRLREDNTGSLRGKMVRIADVGTGSGALGITAQLELPSAKVDLFDIDKRALAVAKTNVDIFTLSISVIQSDLLDQTPRDYDILLCNLPYVPDDFQINRAATHEPAIAIFGGPDGLDLYRKLFSQVAMLKKLPLYILTESLPTQHTALAALARETGYSLYKQDDFIQVFSAFGE